MSAGFETSMTSISWALFCISTHPEVQRGVAAELQAHGLLASHAQPDPRCLDWEDLGKLDYLRNVIKASFMEPK